MVKNSGGWFSQLQEAQASTNNSLAWLNEQICDSHIQIFRYLTSGGSRSNRRFSVPSSWCSVEMDRTFNSEMQCPWRKELISHYIWPGWLCCPFPLNSTVKTFGCSFEELIYLICSYKIKDYERSILLPCCVQNFVCTVETSVTSLDQ